MVWLLSPSTLALAVTVQMYVVPVGTILPLPSCGVTRKLVLEQVMVVMSAITGVGLTVTVRVNGSPMQLPVSPEVGVTV